MGNTLGKCLNSKGMYAERVLYVHYMDSLDFNSQIIERSPFENTDLNLEKREFREKGEF